MIFSGFSNLCDVKLSKDWVIICERSDFENLVNENINFPNYTEKDISLNLCFLGNLLAMQRNAPDTLLGLIN